MHTSERPVQSGTRQRQPPAMTAAAAALHHHSPPQGARLQERRVLPAHLLQCQTRALLLAQQELPQPLAVAGRQQLQGQYLQQEPHHRQHPHQQQQPPPQTLGCTATKCWARHCVMSCCRVSVASYMTRTAGLSVKATCNRLEPKDPCFPVTCHICHDVAACMLRTVNKVDKIDLKCQVFHSHHCCTPHS